MKRVGQCNGGRKADGGTPYDKSRQTYHWLMTKHALVKEGIIGRKNGNADCTCGKVETQRHAHLNCKEHGIPELRKRYVKRRKKMMENMKIPIIGTQLCFIDNLEPEAKDAILTGAAPQCGQVQLQIQTPDGKGSETDGETQRFQN